MWKNTNHLFLDCVWHWHCTKLARYNRSRQCSQKFPLFGYFHLNQTSSQSRAPPLDKVNLIFVENKNVFGSSPIIYFLSTICCIWRVVGWNLFPPGQQKLKSHYVVMPIMILSFINRTYLKYLEVLDTAKPSLKNNRNQFHKTKNTMPKTHMQLWTSNSFQIIFHCHFQS